MNRRERYQFVIETFKKRMPNATTELHFGSVFQLLVATMLSAQCTDKRINMVTPRLFELYPDAALMSKATEEDIFEIIRSVSYPNAKSRHLLAMARMLQEDFQGEVPGTMEELVRLPGVGRKTANVVLAVAYDMPAMPVDTHVFRVAHRMSLVSKSDDTPLKVEQCLLRRIPPEYVSLMHHWLILHGRNVCTSRKPKCEACDFLSICKKRGVE